MEASPRRDLRKLHEDPNFISKSSTIGYFSRCGVHAQRDISPSDPNNNVEWRCFRIPFCNFQWERIHSPALISLPMSCRFCGLILRDDDETDGSDCNHLHSCTPYTLSSFKSLAIESPVCLQADDISILSTSFESHEGYSDGPIFMRTDSPKYVSLKALFPEDRVATSITDESTDSRCTYSPVNGMLWPFRCGGCETRLLLDWRYCPNCGMFVDL
jgi:hypothetical protein